MLLGSCIEGAAQINNLTVDVKTIYRVDTQGQALQGVLLYAAGGSGQDSHVNLTQFLDVLYYGIRCQFSRLVCCSVTAYHACNLHVGSYLQSLQGILANVAITNDGHTNLFHAMLCFLLVVSFDGAKLHKKYHFDGKIVLKIALFHQINSILVVKLGEYRAN